MDCNDADANVHPDAPEICGDDIDNDCNGSVDDTGQGSVTWFQDSDGDGFGDPAVRTLACPGSLIGDGFTTDDTDCDDNLASVNPGVEVDVCNALDDDCDLQVDEDEAALFGGVIYDTIDAALARGSASSQPAFVDVCGRATPIDVRGLIVEGTTELTVRSNPAGTTAILAQPEGGNVVRVRGEAQVTLEGLILEGSTSSPAVIVEEDAELHLDNMVLRSNPAGALRVEGTGVDKAHVVVLNSVIRGNGKSSIDGGGIRAVGQYSMEFDNVVIAENAAARGGGLFLAGATSQVFISKTTIEDNEASGAGGGIHADGIGAVQVRNTTVRTNEAAEGAGMALYDTLVTDDGTTTVTENTASDLGGGAFLRNAELAGFHITQNAAATGGGLFVTDELGTAAYSTLTDSVITANAAADGAGVAVVYANRSTLKATDCAIEDNQATAAGGGVLVDFGVGRGDAFTVVKSSFLRNSPSDVELDTGISCQQSTSPSNFNCSWAGCTECL